jgi:hypothetical protein
MAVVGVVESIRLPNGDEYSLMPGNVTGELKNVSFTKNTSRTITFNTYSTSALIVANANDSQFAMYYYGNGYLCPIKTATSVPASLSGDYKTITISNNTSSGNGYLSVIHFDNTTMTIN